MVDRTAATRCTRCGGPHATRECPLGSDPAAGTEPAASAVAAAPSAASTPSGDFAAVPTVPDAVPAPPAAGAGASKMAPDPLLGQSVGAFRLSRLLGTGSFARVYLGEHPVIGSRVAVKVMDARLSANAELIQRFVGEARATNLVAHDNIIRIIDINALPTGQYYIVMEYLEGHTLADACAGRAMKFAESAPILLQVCEGLAAAHAVGVVHRDLKPENIYLVRRGERMHAKIVDFGIARRETLGIGEKRTTVGTVLGTPYYIAPEQAWGLPVDGRADVYSLGVIMFQLATGRLPFAGASAAELLVAHGSHAPPPPRSINPSIDPEYEAVVLKTLQKRPEDRFQSMAELGKSIAGLWRPATRQFTPAPVALAPMGGAVAVPQPPAQAGPKPATLWVNIEYADGRPAERLPVLSVASGGVFVGTRGVLPEVFTRVAVRPVLDGASPVPGEVVHLVTPGQATAAGQQPGFGVAFAAADITALQRRAVEAMIAVAAGKPVPTVSDDQGETLAVLDRVEALEEDDYYGLIGIPLHADFGAVRAACDHVARALAPERLTAVTLVSRTRLEGVRQRLATAEETLVSPLERIAYDAGRGNFLGVARCLAAGVDEAAVRTLRSRFLAARPNIEAMLQPVLDTAAENERVGQLRDALDALATALKLDPLDLDLHRRYWSLRRRTRK